MKTTNAYKTLSPVLQTKIVMLGTCLGSKPINGIVNGNQLISINSTGNRSLVYTLINQNVILKILNIPADQDVEALLLFGGEKFFPNLYAHGTTKDGNTYLFMEKAQGAPLSQIQPLSPSDSEKIKKQFNQAIDIMLKVKRCDNDLKAEHLFWDTTNKHLTWIDFSLCDKVPSEFTEESKFGLREVLTRIL
ncbi:hypothetical protein AB3K25_05145 [Leuconostoc sp. MS02]|uniref:Protein kinase domain-containing protein n=1 Tax=Leuconostoc aquikimchii TaxID=3236804 RepID=A0ABV3S3R6_9LACO